MVEGKAEPSAPEHRTNYVGTKPKQGYEQKKQGIPSEQIRKKPAFEIYHDPPNLAYRKPLSQRVQTHHLEQGIENLRLRHDPPAHHVQHVAELRPYHGGYAPHAGHSDRRPFFHSTPKRDPVLSSDTSGSQQQGNRWKNPPERSRHFDRERNPHGPDYGENPNIDPYTMDDPAFPDRWRIPLGNVLQNWYKHWDLGKLWKHSDQIAVFEGSIQQYLRWAPTFYEMVHIQPMPWAYKLNILAKKLAPKVGSLVIGGLAFEKKDYITALCRLERYFGGEEKVAQARLAALENFPKIQRDDWVALPKFLDALESYAQSGPFDPYPHSRENVMTMTLIKRRMPPLWYQKFVTWCLEHDRACIPSNFLHWANNRVDPHLLEISFANNGAKRNVTFVTAEDADLGESTLNVVNVNSSDVCIKCGGSHTIKHCEKFYLMQPVERKDLIVQAGRCLCCLGLGHRYEQCNSKARYPICAGKHRLLVHVPAEGAAARNNRLILDIAAPTLRSAISLVKYEPKTDATRKQSIPGST